MYTHTYIYIYMYRERDRKRESAVSWSGSAKAVDSWAHLNRLMLRLAGLMFRFDDDG